MPVRKPGLPICQHIAIGQTLLDAHNALINVSVDVRNAYPNSSKAARLAGRLTDAVDALRCELDNQSANETPNDPDHWSTSIYYGNTSWERNVPRILERHQAENPDCECSGGRA